MGVSNTDWARVKDLFAATFESDAAARTEALEAESDAKVRKKVEAMLAAHDASEGPLDQSVLLAIDPRHRSLAVAVPSLTGRKLGGYHIVREIGRGGMGAVYEAVRDDSLFDKRVAIKTLRIGADSEALLKRFNQERRILG